MLFRLREILLSKNIPFNIFAERMGVNPSSLAVTERFYPSIASVQKCADLLGMPAWELVYDCGVEMTTPYVRPADDPSIEDKVEQRLQTLMTKSNLSYRKLAAKMGVTGAALTQSVKRRKLSLKTVENMAAGLGVEPWELLATPEEVRGEVLRRKAALGIEEEPKPAPAATGAVEDLFANAETEEQEPMPEVTEEERRKFTDFMLTVFEILMKDADKDGVFRLGKYELRMREARG